MKKKINQFFKPQTLICSETVFLGFSILSLHNRLRKASEITLSQLRLTFGVKQKAGLAGRQSRNSHKFYTGTSHFV